MPERTGASVTATVLFTDLAASTELMARLGDAAFDEVRRAHFAGLREVFAAHAGQEIKNTGDGLLVTFGSAADALAAAVAAQQTTVRPDPALPEPIELRVGLALGEVALEGGDVFGTAVVEAARLVARAEAGQILTTAVVRIVAGSRAERGRLDELEAEFVAITERHGAVVESMCQFVALLHCEGGRPDRAREAFAPIVARGYSLPEDSIWLGMNQMAAEIVHQLDDRAGAAVLLERLAPFAGVFSTFAGVSVGCTTQFLGLLEATLGRLDAAIAHLADAAEIYERLGAPAYLGRTRVAWARALLGRGSPGDAEQAQGLLTAAITAAREGGFVAVERRAAALLERG